MSTEHINYNDALVSYLMAYKRATHDRYDIWQIKEIITKY